MHDKLRSGEGEYAGADTEDRDEYSPAENVFFEPVEARWAYLQAQAKQTDVGKKEISDYEIALAQQKGRLELPSATSQSLPV